MRSLRFPVTRRCVAVRPLPRLGVVDRCRRLRRLVRWAGVSVTAGIGEHGI